MTLTASLKPLPVPRLCADYNSSVPSQYSGKLVKTPLRAYRRLTRPAYRFLHTRPSNSEQSQINTVKCSPLSEGRGKVWGVEWGGVGGEWRERESVREGVGGKVVSRQD